MALLDGLLDGVRNVFGYGNNAGGNPLGIDPNAAGLLGMAIANATGNQKMARNMALMQMMNESQAPQQQGTPINGMNPSWQPPVPQQIQNTVNNLNATADNAGLLSKYVQNGVNMNGINPELSKKMAMIISDLEAQGYRPVIASGVRTPEEQAQKVAQGYSQTMRSRHLGGNAVDLIDSRYGWNTQKYNPEIAAYADALAATAKKYGLSTGRSWKSFGPYGDFAHVQF